jgi:hypothetical protein
VLWQVLGAFLSGVGSVVGAGFAIKWVIRHEQQACDARLGAFKEGLNRDDQPRG